MKTGTCVDGKIVIKDCDKPTLADKKGAIVKVSGCGLCGSDIVKCSQHLSKNGTVLGHEIVGEIVELNSSTDFKVGDRIVSSHHIPCFECEYCKHENYSMCTHFKKTNLIPGGFSEYVYLSEEHLKNVAYKIPKNITDEEISFYEPLGCCIRAIKRASLMKNDSVLVVGLGSIGLLMAQGLKAFGMKVFACDLIEDRIKIAKEHGIESFNSLDIEKSKEFIYSKTNNLGANAVFMTSGADKAIDLAFKTVRNGGEILIFASTPKNFGYPNNEIYYRELKILGSYSPSPKDLEESFNLLKDKKVVMKNLTKTYELNDLQKAIDDTINNITFKAYIKIGD